MPTWRRRAPTVPLTGDWGPSLQDVAARKPGRIRVAVTAAIGDVKTTSLLTSNQFESN